MVCTTSVCSIHGLAWPENLVPDKHVVCLLSVRLCHLLCFDTFSHITLSDMPVPHFYLSFFSHSQILSLDEERIRDAWLRVSVTPSISLLCFTAQPLTCARPCLCCACLRCIVMYLPCNHLYQAFLFISYDIISYHLPVCVSPSTSQPHVFHV